jgi:HPt (histidine-containing phosphotransfer) domain-containing protein
MGNIELAQRVLEKFHQRIPEELAELDSALQLGDAERLARISHRLRGCSATVSAEGLAQAAADIEDASRAGRMTDVPVGIERLRDEWRKLRETSGEVDVER